jgi:hypothetical protein
LCSQSHVWFSHLLTVSLSKTHVNEPAPHPGGMVIYSLSFKRNSNTLPKVCGSNPNQGNFIFLYHSTFYFILFSVFLIVIYVSDKLWHWWAFHLRY